MKLRTGVPSDGGPLTTLVAAAFLDYVRGLGKDWPGPYEWMADRLAAGEIEVAEANGALLGMAALTRDPVARTLSVDLLAVSPDAQGCGVGRCLLSHAEALARAFGAGAIHLHTVAKYDYLVRLYEKAGFEITHHGPRPMGDDGHPRAFMRKLLNGERPTP